MDPRHIVFIVMDSCRYDSFMAARTPNIDRLGEAQKRYSYASWTAPSHHTFAMGMMPHTSPKDVFASEVYKDEYAQWKERLPVISSVSAMPGASKLWLITPMPISPRIKRVRSKLTPTSA